MVRLLSLEMGGGGSGGKEKSFQLGQRGLRIGESCLETRLFLRSPSTLMWHGKRKLWRRKREQRGNPELAYHLRPLVHQFNSLHMRL